LTRYRLDVGGVLIVDEASMLSTADMHTLTREVDAVGGQLLVVGDPAQIRAIDAAGGMLAALADRLGAPSLTQVHRFRHAWERIASLQLRHGDPACLDAYLDHERIHPIEADADPYEDILTDYQRLTADGSRVLLLARSHDDVDELNARARHHAIATGDVQSEPLVAVDDQEWRIGDRLRASRNDRRIPVGADGDHLRNGDAFTVVGYTDAGLTVRRLESPDTAVLPPEYLAEHARYGWASTIDAAQGATTDHSLLLARPGLDRTRLYVALTRGRASNHVYLASEPDPEIAPRNQRRPRLNPGDQLARMLATAGDQAAAHTRLPSPPELPTRIPRGAIPAGSWPLSRPAREPDPYRLTGRDEPYHGLSR
jgi:ATP-dependent exoDNAse (exonuclease V) alpha subunit